MQFYFILRFIWRRFPPGKWVPLDQMVEGGSKKLRLLHRHPMDTATHYDDKISLIFTTTTFIHI